MYPDVPMAALGGVALLNESMDEMGRAGVLSEVLTMAEMWWDEVDDEVCVDRYTESSRSVSEPDCCRSMGGGRRA